MLTPDTAVYMSDFAEDVILASIVLCFLTGAFSSILFATRKAKGSAFATYIRFFARCTNASLFAVCLGVTAQMVSWKDWESVWVLAAVMSASVALSWAFRAWRSEGTETASETQPAFSFQPTA